MAKRRKNEFRPDRTQTSFLGKLYVTRKQRLRLLKWGLFAVLLVALLVIQDTVMSRLRIFGATTELVPCGIFLICVFQSAETSCIFALVSGMVYLFSGSAPGTYVLVFLTFLGFGVSAFRQSYLRKGFSATVLCTGMALLIYELAILAAGVVTGVTFWGRTPGFLITWGLTLIAIPILYPIVLSIDKIGGETWKE